jgi:hypothetical protein
MWLPQPEFLSKLHLTVLEIEGIIFNILLFCKFALHEVLDMIRHVRKWGKDGQKLATSVK